MWIDGHLDLAYAAVTGRDLRVPADAADACVSLPDLADGGVGVALATIYTAPAEEDEAGYPSSDDLDAAEAAGLRQLRVYETLADEGALVIVRQAADLIEDSGDVLRIALLMEGADSTLR